MDSFSLFVYYVTKHRFFFFLSKKQVCLSPQFAFSSFLNIFCDFFVVDFFGGGRALLGERVKGQISRVIPAMVTTK